VVGDLNAFEFSDGASAAPHAAEDASMVETRTGAHLASGPRDDQCAGQLEDLVLADAGEGRAVG